MSNAAKVRDVGEADFDADVIERSHEVPILVDFWAPWCGPCRMLGPVLEELATDMQGRFELVKVNTDANPGLGMRYQVRSIPAVKVFHRGKVVTEFVGALPGATIRKLLDEHLPSEIDDAVGAAVALANTDLAAAKAALEQQITAHPEHASARLELARLLLRAGEPERADDVLSELDPGSPQAEVGELLRQLAVLSRECDRSGGEAGARTRLAASADDLEAHFALGCCLASQERWDEALAELLEVVIRKVSFRDRAAVRAMTAIFGLMPRDDVRDDYQRKLQIYS